MSKCDKLLSRARNKPASLSFDELCYLAECHGFEFRRQSGSHRIYQRVNSRELMTFQAGKNGEAKPYQVRQLLDAIDDLL